MVASELVRVTAPGGSAGLAVWTPDGFIARLMQTSRPYRPPLPEGVPEPMAWGDRAHLEELFGELPCELTVAPRTVTFTYSSWDAWRQKVGAHGMVVILEQTLPPDRFEEMIAEMRAFTMANSTVTDGSISHEAEYLEVLVHVEDAR